MSNQSLRQASVRAVTGTTSTYEGDWHALFDLAAIAVGPFNQRLLEYINIKLGVTYTNLPDAMTAFAVDNGAYNWNSLGNFDASVTGSEPDPLTQRSVGNTFMCDSEVSSANFVTQTHKSIYIPNNTTGPFFVKYVNWRMSTASDINGTHTIDVNAKFVYNNVVYPITFNGAATATILTGGETWGLIVGLNSMTAGTLGLITTRRIGTSGSQSRLRGAEINARFQEGAFGGTSTSVDYTENFGRGSTATGTIGGSGEITSVTFNNTSANGFYEDGDSILAYETAANGTIRQELIGTYTISGGNPNTPTISTPGTGWVGPTFVVLNQVSSFGAVTGDIYAPVVLVGTPSSGSIRQALIFGDSNGHGAGDAAMSSIGERGWFERGINGRFPHSNISASGRTLASMTAPATALPKTIAAMKPWFSDIIVHLGGNDALTDSAATIEANLATLGIYWRTTESKAMAVSTIPNRTTSTDGWTTTVNQTPATGFATGGVVDTVNTDIRNGTVQSDWGIIDTRALLQDAADKDSWRVDLGAAITDGTHSNQLGYVLVGADNNLRLMFTDLTKTMVLPSFATAWYDAADTATITHVANAVSQWNDKSGNAYHATQGTGASQPLTNTVTVNSLNAIDLDGSNDFMSLPSGLYGLFAGANTIFVVCKNDSVVPNCRMLHGSLAGTSGVALRTLTSTGYAYQNRTTLSLTTTTVTIDTNPHIYGFFRTGTDITGFRDGVLGTAGTNAENITLDDYGIGRNAAVATDPYNGAMCDIAMFNTNLSTTLKNRIGNYFSLKWNITWTGL